VAINMNVRECCKPDTSGGRASHVVSLSSPVPFLVALPLHRDAGWIANPNDANGMDRPCCCPTGE